MRYSTAGESHGEKLIGIMEGVPSGLRLDFDFINNELKRRQCGYGRGGRMKIESDKAHFFAGARFGLTTGAPLCFEIVNADHKSWANIVDPYAEKTSERALTNVRPGHADLSGVIKYGFDDARNVLERASARETAAKTGLGAVAKLYLKSLGIEIGSRTVAIGDCRADLSPIGAHGLNELCDGSPVRCTDKNAEKKMMALIDECKADGDTLGGEAEIIISSVKSGVGSYVSKDKKLDALFASELMAVQSVKCVEVGDAIAQSRSRGSEAHDEIFLKGKTVVRKSNRAGGIEGGMSNGEDIVLHVYFKPIPTLMKGLSTIDIATGKPTVAAAERSDVCVVAPGAVVCENAAALALMAALCDMLGGDTMDEVIDRYNRKK